MQGLVSGQDETSSNTKYDVSIGENHNYSRLNPNAKLSKLNSSEFRGIHGCVNEKRIPLLDTKTPLRLSLGP